MQAGVALQSKLVTDSCPWCGTTISRSKFLEIQTRITEQERKKLADEREKMQEKLRAELQKAEARNKEESDKKLAAALAVERNAANAKIKALETREAAVRKEATAQAEARLKVEANKKLAALAVERDQATAKLKQAEAAKAKDVEQMRAALEKDRAAQVLKVQAEGLRERAKLQEKVDGLTRQLQKKTSDELGEGAEIDIYEALRDAFPHDEITRIKKGQPGADIRHVVQHKGAPCGTILIDSKNRQGWQNGYVTKLREDQMAAKADHAVLATTVFPSGKKEFYVDRDTRVIVVGRARTVEIVNLLRRVLLRLHTLGLSQNERAGKQDLLYKYMTSEDFRQQVAEAGRLTTELLDLDTDEKRAHDKVWERRGKMATRLRNVVRNIETEVNAIVEGRKSDAGRG